MSKKFIAPKVVAPEIIPTTANGTIFFNWFFISNHFIIVDTNLIQKDFCNKIYLVILTKFNTNYKFLEKRIVFFRNLF